MEARRGSFFISLRVAFLWITTFIMLSGVSGEHQCYWCGPLAEQVHRSRRAPPCDLPTNHVTTCEPGLAFCAIVATSPPYVESRLCVKLYQDECYPLFCNSTRTWKMTCPCRGDLCNGNNTEREKEAFAVLANLVQSQNNRIKKREISPTFVPSKRERTVIITNITELNETNEEINEINGDDEMIVVTAISRDIELGQRKQDFIVHNTKETTLELKENISTENSIENFSTENPTSENEQQVIFNNPVSEVTTQNDNKATELGTHLTTQNDIEIDVTDLGSTNSITETVSHVVTESTTPITIMVIKTEIEEIFNNPVSEVITQNDIKVTELGTHLTTQNNKEVDVTDLGSTKYITEIVSHVVTESTTPITIMVTKTEIKENVTNNISEQSSEQLPTAEALQQNLSLSVTSIKTTESIRMESTDSIMKEHETTTVEPAKGGGNFATRLSLITNTISTVLFVILYL